jgi:cell cycle checkpoint protein
MAFIFSDIFDEYAFHPEPRPVPRIRAQPDRATKSTSKGKQKQGASDLSDTESESEDNAKDSDWKNSEDPSQSRHARAEEEEEASDNAAFEIPLGTLIECLNIFGTAGPSTSSGKGGRGWHGDSDHEERRRDGLEAFFGGQGKRTSMRMSYIGAGYPMTLIM